MYNVYTKINNGIIYWLKQQRDIDHVETNQNLINYWYWLIMSKVGIYKHNKYAIKYIMENMKLKSVMHVKILCILRYQQI